MFRHMYNTSSFYFLQDDARQFFSMASAPGEDGKLSYELGMIMKRLWSDAGVQACFLRSPEYKMIDPLKI